MRMRDFMNRHFLHFNARETREAAQAWVDLLDRGGKMFLTLAGAMSTAELGISLAPLIRAGKVHGICCTGANLEEDVFNLVAHDDYRVIPNWRNLTPELEDELYQQGLNRVTDTCIPETVMRHIDKRILEVWKHLDTSGERGSPWEIMRRVVADDALAEHYQVPREHSWVLAAHEMDVPVWVPGWEDSTLGNIFTGHVILGHLQSHTIVHTGTEQLQHLSEWYRANTGDEPTIGFFQIGGGIAGDYPICVVPMLIQDCFVKDTPFWAYFCQISDSTTSYGSYSGAIPSEKITWGKLAPDTPKYMINSDAAIVGQLRDRYDPSAAAGIPAHITLLSPFAPVTDDLCDELRGFFAEVAPFPFELAQTGRFPDTLYLAPEPVDSFLALIGRLGARYPDHPPYGGAFDTVVPHLTVAHASSDATLNAIGAVVRSTLPIAALATTVLLMEGTNEDGWTEVERFRLGR